MTVTQQQPLYSISNCRPHVMLTYLHIGLSEAKQASSKQEGPGSCKPVVASLVFSQDSPCIMQMLQLHIPTDI